MVVGIEGYQIGEGLGFYLALFAAEKYDIGPENAFFRDIRKV